MLRWLLIECSGTILKRVKKEFPLKAWGQKIEERRGLGKAKVAVARKLSEILLMIWKRNTSFVIPHDNDDEKKNELAVA